MSTAGKSEVNLEISAGFFRISTDTVVYNITVLGGGETGATQVVRQILAEEKPAVPFLAAPEPATESAAPSPRLAAEADEDDYYKQVSNDIFNDIGKLAKSLSSTMGEIPMEDRRMKRVELDEAGEKIEDAKNQLHDIVSMTERATMEIMDQVEKVQNQTDGVKELLLSLKTHNAFQTEAIANGEAGAQSAAATLHNLQEKIGQANALIVALQEDAGAGGEEITAGEVLDLAEAAPEMVKRTRYLFALDTIFQTMYELCTNETVKTHITGARKRAEEIFDHQGFIEAMGEKIKNLVVDDNFFTVPLSDVLAALLSSCSDPKTQNLLKKMDLNQTEIFLDQSLPLEVPPIEEIEEAVPVVAATALSEAVASAPASGQGSDPRVAELGSMLEESLTLAGELTESLEQMHSGQIPGMSKMTIEDQNDIFKKIEDAFDVASSITDDISRITEALSFQDLSGQQILKIIKLLTDFQVQLLAIVVSFGSQLKIKEKNAGITVAESKRIAQEDVDKYLNSMTTGEVGGEGSLDQGAVNDLLQGLGF